MQDANLFFRFGVALFIGILVGMQREYAVEDTGKEMAAGVRTFSLFGLAGCTGAFISDTLNSPWPLAILLLIIGILLSANYYIEARSGKVGLTTETSALLTVLLGALTYWNQLTLAVAISVSVTVLLSVKFQMHQFAQKITREDIYATLKFAVITAIILPVLPNRTFGVPPFDVFNPFKIWLLVVFISGISFIGYILIKIIGTQRGIGLTGFLGGFASSTAVTLSFTQRSKENPQLARSFALAIIISWTVMFLRVLVEVAAVNYALIKYVWLPILGGIVVGLVYCVYLLLSHNAEGKHQDMTFSNPFELGPAIKFGFLFLLILFISKSAQIYLGTTGIYLSSIISGFADVDAITLSMAELSKGNEGMELHLAGRAIVLAAVSNTFAKGGIVLALGSANLRRSILLGFLMMMITSLCVAFCF
jgi:uncharacterized membrane protein (DUF4010 family)